MCSNKVLCTRKLLTLAAVVALAGMIPSSAFAESKSVAINVSVSIAPLFELDVSGPANGNIEFGYVHKDPNGPVSVDSGDVVLTARTNKHKPYQITQMLVTPLENNDGDAFGSKDLTAYARSEKPGGMIVNGGAVSTTPSALFTSDAEGLSNTVRTNYKLNIPPEQGPGDYKSKLVYTITTL